MGTTGGVSRFKAHDEQQSGTGIIRWQTVLQFIEKSADWSGSSAGPERVARTPCSHEHYDR